MKSLVKVLMVLALVAVICLPGVALGDTLYTQNFDAVGQAALTSPGAGNTTTLSSILPGWSVTANNANQANVNVANGTVGGYGVGAYLATGDGTDFNLSSYQTSAGAVNFITYTYTATGTGIVSNITGSFDFESAWSRYGDAATNSGDLRTAGFENGLGYSINGGTAVALSGTSTHVNNGTLAIATTWLTDAQMVAAGLSVDNILFSLTGVTLNPGDTVTFKWDQSINAGDKNMAQGIDNFTMSGDQVPLPPSALLLGSGLLGLVGLGWRRRQTS